jgi:hypothetical protein
MTRLQLRRAHVATATLTLLAAFVLFAVAAAWR